MNGKERVLGENKIFWDETEFWISRGFDHAWFTTINFHLTCDLAQKARLLYKARKACQGPEL